MAAWHGHICTVVLGMFTNKILSIMKHWYIYITKLYEAYYDVYWVLQVKNKVHKFIHLPEVFHVPQKCSWVSLHVSWFVGFGSMLANIYIRHIFLKKRERQRDRPPDWLCHQRALIRRAGPQRQEHRLCRGRNTEERLEHKHLPQSPCFPLASGEEMVLQTHSSDTRTHTHIYADKQNHAYFWQMHSDVVAIK